MKKQNKIERRILRDCYKATKIPVLFHIINTCLDGLVGVYTAKTLGEFADAIFNLDKSVGMNHIWNLLLCVGILVFVMPVVELIENFFMLKMSLVHERMLLGNFLDKTYEKVLKFDIGNIQYRLEQDAIDLRIYWVEVLSKFVMILATISYLFYQTLKISVIYTIVVMGVSLLKLFIPIIVKKLEARYDKETRKYNAQVRVYEIEIVKTPYVIKLFGLSKPLVERLGHIYQEYYKRTFCKSVKCTAIAKNVSSVLDTFCLLIILFVGAVMVAGKSISPGSVAAMTGYFAVFNMVFSNVDYIIRKLPLIGNLVERMKDLYDDQEALFGKMVEEVSVIEAEGLSFSYGEQPVFQGVDFRICSDGEAQFFEGGRSGKKIAISGENGSGKSTLVKLLCGLLKDYKGSLKLNGQELNDIAIESWRSQFAYAAQEPYLFSGSVKENIHLGNRKATEQEVEKVMEEVGISYLADREVTMKQNNLSGGEKQKISIARALMKNTKFLILDEPSNHLDRQTQDWLCSFIANSKKTILYISHDNHLLDYADVRIHLP